MGKVPSHPSSTSLTSTGGAKACIFVLSTNARKVVWTNIQVGGNRAFDIVTSGMLMALTSMQLRNTDRKGNTAKGTSNHGFVISCTAAKVFARRDGLERHQRLLDHTGREKASRD